MPSTMKRSSIMQSSAVDLCEEPLRHIRRQQPIEVLRKHRMVPYRVLHAQPDGSSEQRVGVHLLHQLPLRTHQVEGLGAC